MLQRADDNLHRAHPKRLLTVAIFLVLTTILGLTPCHGIESFIAWPAIDSDSESILQAAGRFLGVEQEYVQTFGEIEDRWGRKEPPSLMIITDTFITALSSKQKQKLKDAVALSQVNPMIVLDRSEPKASEAFLDGFTKYVSDKTMGVLNFSSEHAETLKELGGLKLPVFFEEKSVFLNIDQREDAGLEPLIWLQDAEGGRHVVMAVKKVGQGRLYLSALPKCRIARGNETFRDLPKVLPVLIFLKKEGGEFCWHRKTITANLTIDDPWLVEPYGNLSYTALLEQMEKAKFHTTIAFIPWYYDRSHREVVDLFLKNPERYSIAFHGNNHDRREFGNYEDHPYEIQETGIRQAIARMVEFSRLTGIQASKVMVFPHGIAPEKTLSALQKYNFIATINSSILPLGNAGPVGIDAMLWPVALKYDGFPVIQRFNPRVDKTTIDILIFLEKPLLFYTHQDYFYKNMGAFNEVAEYVNQKTGGRARWVDLKQVCDDLYMERRRADGGHDIQMLARSVSVVNSTTNMAYYHVNKNFWGNSDPRELVIAGASHVKDFEQQLDKPKALKPGERLSIEFLYGKSPEETGITVERRGFRNYFLRWASNFRDRYLSTNGFGRKLIELTGHILDSSY